MNRQQWLFLGFWLLVNLAGALLVMSYVAIKSAQIQEQIGRIVELEARRALNASRANATVESGMAKQCASRVAILRTRQDQLERELVRRTDLEHVATHAQVEALTRAIRRKFKLTIKEIRYPNAHLPSLE